METHSLLLSKLINELNLQRRLQIRLPQLIKPICGNVIPSHRHLLPRQLRKHHWSTPTCGHVLQLTVTENQALEDVDALLEGDGEGD